MRILLVNPPYKVYSTSKTQLLIPRNLIVLAACLLETGFPEKDLCIFDMPIERASLGDLQAKVQDFDPDLIGIGIHAAPFIPDVSHCVEAIKTAKPSVKIVTGGMLPTNFKKRVFALIPGIDAVFSDDAEETFVNFVQHLSQGGAFPQGEVIQPPHSVGKREVDYPLPAYSLLPLDAYRVYYADATTFEEEFAPHLEVMRGCPFPCNFCGVSRVVRLRPLPHILEELKYLASQGFRKLYFCDETFTLIPKRTQALCEALIELGESFQWRCVTRSDSLAKNPHLIPLMKAAGCYEVGIGIEVGSQEMLDKLEKKTTLATQVEATRQLQQHGINVNALLVICSPHETPKDIHHTLKFVARELKPTYSQVFIFHPVPSTTYYNEAAEHGLSIEAQTLEDWYNWDHTGEPVSDTPNLSRNDIIKYYLLFNHALPTIIEDQPNPALLDRLLDAAHVFPKRRKEVVFHWQAPKAYFYSPNLPDEIRDGNLFRNDIRIVPLQPGEVPAYDDAASLAQLSDRLHYEVMLRSNGDFTIGEIAQVLVKLFDLSEEAAGQAVDAILKRFQTLNLLHESA